MHTPVLTQRCMELLGPALDGPTAVLLDATVGMGGHSLAFLERHVRLRIIGIDRDPEALQISRDRLAAFTDRLTLAHARHVDIGEVLADAGVPRVDGVLFDLGVSSLQIDSRARGFSYACDAPLDMRMDPGDELTASAVVNEYSESDLRRVLRDFGEEPHARRIAAAIVAERRVRRIETSNALVEIIRGSVPAVSRRRRGHPAKRVFQALRIEVNGELSGLPAALDQAIASLVVGGRIAVISYHSLEDRIVKRRLEAGALPDVPPDFPVIPDEARPSLHRLTRRPGVPSDREVSVNPRAASARVRVAERIREAQ